MLVLLKIDKYLNYYKLIARYESVTNVNKFVRNSLQSFFTIFYKRYSWKNRRKNIFDIKIVYMAYFHQVKKNLMFPTVRIVTILILKLFKFLWNYSIACNNFTYTLINRLFEIDKILNEKIYLMIFYSKYMDT